MSAYPMGYTHNQIVKMLNALGEAYEYTRSAKDEEILPTLEELMRMLEDLLGESEGENA